MVILVAFSKTAGAVLHQELSRTEMIYTHGLDLMSAVPSPYVTEQVTSTNLQLWECISHLKCTLLISLSSSVFSFAIGGTFWNALTIYIVI